MSEGLSPQRKLEMKASFVTAVRELEKAIIQAKIDGLMVDSSRHSSHLEAVDKLKDLFHDFEDAIDAEDLATLKKIGLYVAHLCYFIRQDAEDIQNMIDPTENTMIH
jgi:hypothetical protein